MESQTGKQASGRSKLVKKKAYEDMTKEELIIKLKIQDTLKKYMDLQKK